MAPPMVTVVWSISIRIALPHTLSIFKENVELTSPQTNLPSNRPSTYNRGASTTAVSQDCTSRNPPVILTCGHRNRRYLRSIAPFAQKCHDKGLHPRGRQQ